MIELFLLLIAVVFVLFFLFNLSKNDFVLLRKNVSQHELFDKVILSMVVGLLLARIFYIVDVQNFSLFNPFRFFHLFRLPGLSLYGFFVGIIPIMYLFLKKKKVVYRVYDIFFISLIPLFIFSLVTRPYSLMVPDFVVKFILFLAGVLLLYIFIQFFHNYTLRDGSIALILFIVVSLDLLLYDFTINNKPLLFSLTLSQMTSVLLSAPALVLFLRNQGILLKKK